MHLEGKGGKEQEIEDSFLPMRSLVTADGN